MAGRGRPKLSTRFNSRERQRIVDYFEERMSIEKICWYCMDDDREYLSPDPTALRKYMDEIGLWPKGTPRPEYD